MNDAIRFSQNPAIDLLKPCSGRPRCGKSGDATISKIVERSPGYPLVRPNLPRWPVPATYDRWLLSATADLPRPATGGYDRTVERFDEIGRIRPLEVAL